MANINIELTAPLRSKHPYVDVNLLEEPSGNSYLFNAGYENNSKETPNVYELIGGVIKLQCSADVANRSIVIGKHTYDWPWAIQGGFVTGVIVASEVGELFITQAEEKYNLGIYNEGNVVSHLSIRPGWVIVGRDYILVTPNTAVAADLVSYHLRFKHMNRFLEIRGQGG